MNIEGFDKIAAEKFNEVAGQASSWPMTKQQSDEIEKLLMTEADAIKELGELQLVIHSLQGKASSTARKAASARESREAFCRGLEKDLNIPKGINWIVNFEKQQIEKRRTD